MVCLKIGLLQQYVFHSRDIALTFTMAFIVTFVLYFHKSSKSGHDKNFGNNPIFLPKFLTFPHPKIPIVREESNEKNLLKYGIV